MPEYSFQSIKELYNGNSAGGGVPVIAGPCSAENEQCIIDTASGVKQAGATLFRAGLWKPRTRPGSFEGVGATGLPWLRKAKSKTGLKFITEVARAEHVLSAVRGGCDGLWIGARTTANPFAVQEIADTLKELRVDIPVLIKNPVNPDLDLWIGAIERFYNSGIRKLGAIHRGFSRYGDTSYRNPPIWAIPIELRRRFPDLPMFHDPSHCGGQRNLIGELSQQALDLGFDGLMIESHSDPDMALSDSQQQITPNELRSIIQSLLVRKNKSEPVSLADLRSKIDILDSELISILSQRMEICRNIGELKLKYGMPVIQQERYSKLLSERIEEGSGEGILGIDFLRNIFSSIHEESVQIQLELMKNAVFLSSRKK